MDSMMQRCLVCNARLKSEICRRCHADYRLLFQCELAADFYRNQSIQACLQQDNLQALKWIELAINLSSSRAMLQFRQLLLKQETEHLVDLLSNQHYWQAKRRLFALQAFWIYSSKLECLNRFTDYLLIKYSGK